MPSRPARSPHHPPLINHAQVYGQMVRDGEESSVMAMRARAAEEAVAVGAVGCCADSRPPARSSRMHRRRCVSAAGLPRRSWRRRVQAGTEAGGQTPMQQSRHRMLRVTLTENREERC